jgi:hypothetical protein
MTPKFVRCVVAVALTVGSVGNVRGEPKRITVVRSETMNVYLPEVSGKKLPVVFFAHNGRGNKDDWGDFPQKLADEGFVSVSIGWTSFNGSDEISDAIASVLKDHADKIDTKRVAFVGGCHGGVEMVPLMAYPSSPYQLKAAVFLSIVEAIELPPKHVPILGLYATDDHLGESYRDFAKNLVEETMTEPKKAVAVKGTPHGNELVTDAVVGPGVQAEITAWLKRYLIQSQK